MPFYEYECQACKYYTEVMQKISEAPLLKCPSCGKRRLRKLVSAPVFRLKGGGWYETDFKSDQENKRNLLGAEKEEPKADSKAETKDAKPGPTETKPETAKGSEAKPEARASAPAARTGTRTGARGRQARGAARASGTRRKAARKPRR